MDGEDGPMYARIERDLRRAIGTGALPLGARLPSEDELHRQYGVSRMTARQAVERLADAGLVVRRQGAGSFVANTKVERATGRLQSFHEDAAARGLAPSTRVLSHAVDAAGPEDAALLGISETDRVLRVRRLRFHGEDPIGINAVLVAPPFVEALTHLDFTGSFYRGAEAALGVGIATAETAIEAVAADAETASLLTLPPGAPLLRTTRVTYLSDGRLLGATRTTYRGDRYYLALTIHRTEPAMSG